MEGGGMYGPDPEPSWGMTAALLGQGLIALLWSWWRPTALLVVLVLMMIQLQVVLRRRRLISTRELDLSQRAVVGHAYIRTCIVWNIIVVPNERLIWIGWMLLVGGLKATSVVLFDRAVRLDRPVDLLLQGADADAERVVTQTDRQFLQHLLLAIAIITSAASAGSCWLLQADVSRGDSADGIAEGGWDYMAAARWLYDPMVVVFVALNGVARLQEQEGQLLDGAADPNNGRGAGGVVGAGGAAVRGDGPHNRVGGIDHSELRLQATILIEASAMLFHLHIMYLIGLFSMSFTNVLLFFKARISWLSICRAVIAHVEKVRTASALQRQLEQQLHHVTSEVFLAHDGPCPICWEHMEEAAAAKLRCRHLFHRSCLTKWLSREQYCPVCFIKLDAETGGEGGDPPTQPGQPAPAHTQAAGRVAGADAGGGGPEPQRWLRWLIYLVSRREPPQLTQAEVARMVRCLTANPFASMLDQITRLLALSQHRCDSKVSNAFLLGFRALIVPPFDGVTPLKVGQLSEMFPDIDADLISADLQLTQSLENTTENLLEGRVRAF
jgi:hypothetical protein